MQANTTLKYLGFTAVLVVLVLLLRPDLFFSSQTPPTALSDAELMEEEALRSSSTKIDEYEDPRRPSLLKKEAALSNIDEDGITMYAEGYDESDFGDAFKEPEDMFKITKEESQPSAGGLWETLLKLEFSISYDKALDNVAMRPKFTDQILAYKNKVIEIDGYIIPFDIVADATGNHGDGTMFMLSAFPAATCFFCKGAGPESVMEVYPKKPIPYSKTVVRVKGRLELNDLDFMKMAYILKDAEIVE